MNGRLRSATVIKEARALLPVWLASLAAVGLRAVAGERFFGADTTTLIVLGYVVGSLALGAQAIGHEYGYRTLGILLAQPSDRRRLLLTKLGVAAVMLLALNAVTWSIPSNQRDFNRAWSWYGPEVLLLSALFVAPWLTMVCRSALAGSIFTYGLGALFWIVSVVFLLAKDGANGRTAINGLSLAMWAMSGACAFGAVATWRTFMRLEAGERRTAMRLPRWLRSRLEGVRRTHDTASSRRQRPMWLLVKKELQIQQMTFVIAALYVFCWAAAVLMERFVPDFPVDFPLLPVTIMYFALLSIVIGSLASAEERQFGTLEWQVLLPMAMWRQWMVKVAVVVGLAFALGVALPIALSYVHVSEDVRVQGALLWNSRVFVERMTTTIIVLTACGLYLSSLSSAGVQSLVLSVPVTFVGVALLPYGAYWARGLAWFALRPRLKGAAFHGSPNAWVRFASDHFLLATASGLVALLLTLGLQNHRSSERSIARMWRQGIWIAGYLTLVVLLLAGVETFMRTRLY